MEVILLEDYPQLGFVGERVVVRSGYARNFLIPRGLVERASAGSARALEHRQVVINARRKEFKTKAEQVAASLAELRLEFTLKMGESGKSFGSVGVRDIQLALEGKGFQFDRRQIHLAEPIKKEGEHTIEIRLHSEVSKGVVISVKPEKVVEKVVSRSKDDEVLAKGGRKGRERDKKKEDEVDKADEGVEESAD